MCTSEPEIPPAIPPDLVERLQDLTPRAPVVFFREGNPLEAECEWSRNAVTIL